MKKISIIASALLISSSILSADITIKEGWQNLGATQNMSPAVFNDTCVDYIWKYDSQATTPEWKIHVANGTDYAHGMNTISSFTKGEGYWAKGSSECTIPLAEPTSTSYDTSLFHEESIAGIGFTDPNAIGRVSFDAITVDLTIPAMIMIFSVDGVIGKLDVATEYNGNTFEVVTSSGITYVGTLAENEDFSSPTVIALKP